MIVVGLEPDAALSSPVVITKYDRPRTVLMSAATFEVLTKGRVARAVEDLDGETLRAIATASLAWHGEDFVDRVVILARKEPKFRHMVG